MAEHTKLPWSLDGLYVTTREPPIIGPSIADCGKSPTLGRGTQAANAAFIVKAVNSHDMLVRALETAAARFNLMAGVGLVNGADPKTGYSECMAALRTLTDVSAVGVNND